MQQIVIAILAEVIAILEEVTAIPEEEIAILEDVITIHLVVIILRESDIECQVYIEEQGGYITTTTIIGTTMVPTTARMVLVL